MDFINPYFPTWFLWLTGCCSLSVVLFALTSLLRSYHQKKSRIIQWLWSVFFLCIIWMMRASVESGINLHLSGAMLMALLFGWRLGFLGMCLVNTLVCFTSDVLFINLGVAVVLNALLPVTLSYFIFLMLEAKLPRHFFIYIYGSAFFGSWIVNIVSGVSIAICLAFFDIFEWSLLKDDFLLFYFILGFSEAFLTAGLITLFVVYRPAWVYSFRDQRYISGK